MIKNLGFSVIVTSVFITYYMHVNTCYSISKINSHSIRTKCYGNNQLMTFQNEKVLDTLANTNIISMLKIIQKD